MLKLSYPKYNCAYIIFIPIHCLHMVMCVNGRNFPAVKNSKELVVWTKCPHTLLFRLALNLSCELWVQGYLWWRGEIMWLWGTSFIHSSLVLIKHLTEGTKLFSSSSYFCIYIVTSEYHAWTTVLQSYIITLKFIHLYTPPNSHNTSICYAQTLNLLHVSAINHYLQGNMNPQEYIIILTLCRSNLNPYCLGRKAAFFSVGI
jgi:hypothetical protein